MTASCQQTYTNTFKAKNACAFDMHGAGKIGGLLLVFLLASVLLDGFSVQAGVRTLVVPEDYANLSDAIANAKNGDTIFIKEGVYEGPINQTLSINKSLS